MNNNSNQAILPTFPSNFSLSSLFNNQVNQGAQSSQNVQSPSSSQPTQNGNNSPFVTTASQLPQPSFLQPTPMSTLQTIFGSAPVNQQIIQSPHTNEQKFLNSLGLSSLPLTLDSSSLYTLAPPSPLSPAFSANSSPLAPLAQTTTSAAPSTSVASPTSKNEFPPFPQLGQLSQLGQNPQFSQMSMAFQTRQINQLPQTTVQSIPSQTSQQITLPPPSQSSYSIPSLQQATNELDQLINSKLLSQIPLYATTLQSQPSLQSPLQFTLTAANSTTNSLVSNSTQTIQSVQQFPQIQMSPTQQMQFPQMSQFPQMPQLKPALQLQQFPINPANPKHFHFQTT